MQRRIFLRQAAASLTSASLGGLVLSACTTSATPTVTATQSAQGSSQRTAEQQRREIDVGADSVIERLHTSVPASRELLAKANGVLIFPRVIAAGLGIGGQYGEGVLRIRNTSVEHYSLASVSIGLQIGAQSKAVVVLFMTEEALTKLRTSNGWSAGIDASVAVLKVGANGALDTSSISGPVLAFVLTNAGLMANLTLEGTKITRLKP